MKLAVRLFLALVLAFNTGVFAQQSDSLLPWAQNPNDLYNRQQEALKRAEKKGLVQVITGDPTRWAITGMAMNLIVMSSTWIIVKTKMIKEAKDAIKLYGDKYNDAAQLRDAFKRKGEFSSANEIKALQRAIVKDKAEWVSELAYQRKSRVRFGFIPGGAGLGALFWQILDGLFIIGFFSNAGDSIYDQIVEDPSLFQEYASSEANLKRMWSNSMVRKAVIAHTELIEYMMQTFDDYQYASTIFPEIELENVTSQQLPTLFIHSPNVTDCSFGHYGAAKMNYVVAGNEKLYLDKTEIYYTCHDRSYTLSVFPKSDDHWLSLGSSKVWTVQKDTPCGTVTFDMVADLQYGCANSYAKSAFLERCVSLEKEGGSYRGETMIQPVSATLSFDVRPH